MTKPRWFEDFRVGDEVELGERTLSAEEIVAFGRAHDPQPFHVDEEAAKDSVFGGLVASGLQSIAVWSRLYVDELGGENVEHMGGTGIEETRFLKPLRPGMRVRAKVRIAEARPSTKRADRGHVSIEGTLRDDEDELVLLARLGLYVRRRPSADVTAS
jgi:acyl dehydratase